MSWRSSRDIPTLVSMLETFFREETAMVETRGKGKSISEGEMDKIMCCRHLEDNFVVSLPVNRDGKHISRFQVPPTQ